MKVLVSAYSCEPGKGSEPGAGYGVLRAAAAAGDCWVITRSNNIVALEEALRRDPPPGNVTLVGVDGPALARRLKRIKGFLRLYYAIWQRLAFRRARALEAEVGGFDAVHHATMSGFWLPVGVRRLRAPLVLGPMSGGTFTPLPFIRYLGLRNLVLDLIRWTVAVASAPFVRRTWRSVRVLIVQNRQMEAFAKQRLVSAGTSVVRCSHALHPHLRAIPEPRPRVPEVLFVGRLVGWKGVLMAVEAFARADLDPETRLVFIGDGPDAKAILRKARRIGLGDRVQILGQLPRQAVLERMRSASCLLFPSFHDSAGFVVSEALSLGLPVVCLDHGGPGEILRSFNGTESRSIPVASRSRTLEELSHAVSDFVRRPRPMSRERVEPNITLTAVVSDVYDFAMTGGLE